MDRKNYLEAQLSRSVTVVKGAPLIVWKPTETEFTYGSVPTHSAHTYIHSLTHSDIHSLHHMSIHTRLAAVDGTASECDMREQSGRYSMCVAAVCANLTFPLPPFLPAGKFVYDPAAGTRLENGQYSVTCRFVPAMPHNFHAVELRRDFFVHRAVPKLCWNPPCAPMGSPF